MTDIEPTVSVTRESRWRWRCYAPSTNPMLGRWVGIEWHTMTHWGAHRSSRRYLRGLAQKAEGQLHPEIVRLPDTTAVAE